MSISPTMYILGGSDNRNWFFGVYDVIPPPPGLSTNFRSPVLIGLILEKNRDMDNRLTYLKVKKFLKLGTENLKLGYKSGTKGLTEIIKL